MSRETISKHDFDKMIPKADFVSMILASWNNGETWEIIAAFDSYLAAGSYFRKLENKNKPHIEYKRIDIA